jgi:replication gene A protein
MQENYINGLPRRWGASLSALFEKNKDEHEDKRRMVWELQSDAFHLPITSTLEEIATHAEQTARECYALCDQVKTVDAILEGIKEICDRKNVKYHESEKPRDTIARAIDPVWWNRQLRKEVARTLEHVAIQLGFTSLKQGPYISTESAIQQIMRNRQNAKLLESKVLVNQHGQEYKMSDLADLGIANKKIRLGELMTRMRGFEEIAFDMNHVAMFWTITCPSKFHAVGGENKKYNGATPRDAQAYLVAVWARIRAAFQRAAIKCYGIRIAEPHTDGCPHWHMMLFVEKYQQEKMESIITRHALDEDGYEPGALKNRVKLVRIEAGKGSAAGYIIKYISKNVAGEGVGEHKTRDGYTITNDLFDGIELTPSDRVTCWAQRWGIRQFQQIGGAPIGVWRELRRVKAETVQQAPEVIKAAWRAVQKIESDDAAIAKQADFAAYVNAQGGPFVGRNGAVRVATKMVLVEGRYETGEQERPCGVYAIRSPDEVYESVRYQWTLKGEKCAANPGMSPVFFALPWTGVNNCTRIGFSTARKMEVATKKLVKQVENKIFPASLGIDWPEIVRQGKAVERETKNFTMKRNNHVRNFEDVPVLRR